MTGTELLPFPPSPACCPPPLPDIVVEVDVEVGVYDGFFSIAAFKTGNRFLASV